MTENKYLTKIHSKIRYKKRRDNTIGSIGAMTLCLVVFFTVAVVEEEILFDDLYQSISYYEWELIESPTSEEIFDYLIDYTCIEDYDEIMDENIMEIIDNMNLGG